MTFPVVLSSVLRTLTTSFLVSDFSRVLNFILAMACSKTTNTAEFQKFLDTNQYCKSGILRYEQIFGIDYVSVGGQTTTAKFCSEHLDHLEEKQKVLDVGCGIGGSAFYMARSIFKTRSNHLVSSLPTKSSYYTNVFNLLNKNDFTINFTQTKAILSLNNHAEKTGVWRLKCHKKQVQIKSPTDL